MTDTQDRAREIGWDTSIENDHTALTFTRGDELLFSLIDERAAIVIEALAARAAEARREGEREGIRKAAQWHRERAKVAAPGTGNASKHEWYAEQLLALDTPEASEAGG